jgi:hypothetical protein
MKQGDHPHTHGLRIGDLNGDGHLDIATANHEDDDIAVVLGNGLGDFDAATGSPFPVEPAPYPFAMGDINGDSFPDMVVSSTPLSGHALTILLNDGQAGFQRSSVTLRTPRSWYVAIGDVTGDGISDLAATHSERPELSVLAGDGSGGFSEVGGSPFDLGHSAWQIGLADVNADGHADVVAAAGDGVRVMLGDGAGSFEPAQGSPFLTGGGSWRLALGDLNGDGNMDIAAANQNSDSVSILLGRQG